MDKESISRLVKGLELHKVRPILIDTLCQLEQANARIGNYQLAAIQRARAAFTPASERPADERDELAAGWGAVAERWPSGQKEGGETAEQQRTNERLGILGLDEEELRTVIRGQAATAERRAHELERCRSELVSQASTIHTELANARAIIGQREAELATATAQAVRWRARAIELGHDPAVQP